jgi:hypothetical protein
MALRPAALVEHILVMVAAMAVAEVAAGKAVTTAVVVAERVATQELAVLVGTLTLRATKRQPMAQAELAVLVAVAVALGNIVMKHLILSTMAVQEGAQVFTGQVLPVKVE